MAIKRAFALLVAVGFAVAACDASLPPSVAPSNTPGARSSAPSSADPTSSPSPSPHDVSAAFQAAITSANQGSFTINGSLDAGTSHAVVSGSLDYASGDSSEVLTITTDGLATTTATVRSKGLEYRKLGDGPWLKDAKPPASGSDLWTYFHGLSGITDAGIDSRGGFPAHRLEPPAATRLDPGALGLVGSDYVDPRVSVVFFADGDGRPVSMVATVAATGHVGGVATPETIVLDLAFGPSRGGTIAAPQDVWGRFTSKRFHFSDAYPSGWTTDTTQLFDDYMNGPGVTHVGGHRRAADGRSLGSWTKARIALHLASPKDYILLGNQAATLDGEPARMVTSTYHDGGKLLVCFEVIAIHGSYMYDIFWVSPVGNRDAGLAVFRQMLATYAFAG